MEKKKFSIDVQDEQDLILDQEREGLLVGYLLDKKLTADEHGFSQINLLICSNLRESAV